jgi:hypothetical protein
MLAGIGTNIVARRISAARLLVVVETVLRFGMRIGDIPIPPGGS